MRSVDDMHSMKCKSNPPSNTKRRVMESVLIPEREAAHYHILVTNPREEEKHQKK